ncbi:8009_t:CDS:2 [Funneliformis mosseae]|uniref:8009_t:CDS:1 n=1 Tax=Funneliformis mosseae TaxID=27381 RepID=A0A9N9AFR1_FUNMO|nr:8009_t:CDS:2 [Funneliformis mosseae]
MSNTLLNPQRIPVISSYFFLMILLSFYVIEVFTNPIQSPLITPAPSSINFRKRQAPVDCGGLVTFSKFDVFFLEAQNTITFLVEGKSSVNLEDIATVKISIYWDSARSLDYYINPTDYEIYPIDDDLSTNVKIKSTQVVEESLDFFKVPGSSAYAFLSVIKEDETLGCATASLDSIPTGAFPYLFNVPAVLGTVSVVIFFVVSKASAARTFSPGDIINQDNHQPSSGTVTQQTNLNSTAHHMSEKFPGYNSANINDVGCGHIPKDSFAPLPHSDGNASHDPTSGISTTATDKVDTHQSLSIYDLFRAAQFFVTTALISLPGLSYSYRDLASKLGWSCGLPSGFNVKFLSNFANEGVRKSICNMTNFCSSLTDNNSTCIQGDIPTPSFNVTGFATYGNVLKVPEYNLFFVMIITFSSTVGIALVIALLIGLLAKLCKCLWKKWPALKMAAKNFHFLVFGGILRVLLLFYYPLTLFSAYQLSLYKDCWLFLLLAVVCITFLSLGAIIFCGYKIFRAWKNRAQMNNQDEFKKPEYTLLYSSLYTQYKDHTDKDCILFFIYTFAYDFFRALVIGLGQQIAILQIVGLSVTEMTYFALLLYFQPFKTSLMNYLKLCISFLRFVIVCMLIAFLSGMATNIKNRIIIEMIIKSSHFFIMGMLVMTIVINLVIAIKDLVTGKDNKDNHDEKLITNTLLADK